MLRRRDRAEPGRRRCDGIVGRFDTQPGHSGERPEDNRPGECTENQRSSARDTRQLEHEPGPEGDGHSGDEAGQGGAASGRADASERRDGESADGAADGHQRQEQQFADGRGAKGLPGECPHSQSNGAEQEQCETDAGAEQGRSWQPGAAWEASHPRATTRGAAQQLCCRSESVEA
jgi:hypothetical protein